MDLRWLAVGLIACYFLYRYVHRKLSYFKLLDIPHLPPTFFFGNMADASLHRRHLSEVVREIYNFSPEAKYVGAYDFMAPAIMIRDPELIKSVLIKNFDHFMNHGPFFGEGVDPLFDGNLFNLLGEKWRESRHLITPSFTLSKLKGMFGLMVEVAEQFVGYIGEQADNPKNVLQMKDLFTRYTNDVIATCAFGIRVDSLKDPNNEFYLNGRRSTNLGGMMSIKFFISRAFPGLMKRLNIKFMSEELEQYYIDIVSKTVTDRKEKGVYRQDMLQLLMEAQDKESGKSNIDLLEITAHVFTFYFGGFESTSTQLCLLAHELAANPDVQKRLQDEIDEVLSETNGVPTFEAINRMRYLDAVFKETVRYHTQAPFLDRVCTKAFELPPALPGKKPYTIQPGTGIWIPTSGIHRDPKYFDNPDKFDPDRYYGQEMHANDVFYMGFGIGPRHCIGQRFANLEIKILMFYLLAKFTLKPNAKTSIPLEYSLKSISADAKTGFWLSIEARKDLL